MFKVLVPLWVDGFGPFAEGSEQAFDGAPVEVVETHPHHVGTGTPAPGTWEAIWSREE